MALTNVEKQARCRERHLGAVGEKARVQLVLSAATKAQLGRLANHNGYTVTAMIEKMAADTEQRIVARLNPKVLKAYYDGQQPL